MIISLNWLKKFSDVDLSVDELATLIGARLVEIEGVEHFGAKYKGVVVAKVIECKPIEGTDHLNVTKIDDGGAVEGVARDENGFVQVVCGAPNVREGLLVAWLAPGVTVPETHGKEPFVLGARELRGVTSNGMLASAKELDLFEDHSGILEIDGEYAPGMSLADVFELDDYLLDIENKSLTHRPDTFGIVGFAREVAGIQGKKFTTPDWLQATEPQYGEKHGDAQAPIVYIDNPELSSRYQAVVMSNADANRAAPLLIQTYLARVGVRPINAVVDVTNYLMMLTGQPLHAFDYDKVLAVSGGNGEIHVRGGGDGETLELLDGRVIKLATDDIVIAAGETAIGLAGAMGGKNTEIDANTKNIIIESATFNLYNLRATQMRHGIFSEAITRFTKGQPAALTAPVLAEAVRLMSEWAGATRVSDVADAYPGKRDPEPIRVQQQDMINGFLGSDYGMKQITDTLLNVEFAVDIEEPYTVVATAPYWRNDIHIVEDVVEEIGRLNGFDTIKPTLPMRDFTAVRPSSFDQFRGRLRQTLVRGGANEVLTYSFVHGDILTKAGQTPDDSYRIVNSLSPDLQYYRQSLTPSLLGLVHPNIKAGYDTFAVFEINKVHAKSFGTTDESVPVERTNLGFVFAAKNPQPGAAYYHAKKYALYATKQLGAACIVEPVADESNDPRMAPFERSRSAYIRDAASGSVIGVVGEYTSKVKANFKLSYTAGFELDVDALYRVSADHQVYRSLSRYPGAQRDICFKVAADLPFTKLESVIAEALGVHDIETVCTPIDIYQPQDGGSKNITLRITLISHEQTLTNNQITSILGAVSDEAARSVGAEIV